MAAWFDVALEGEFLPGAAQLVDVDHTMVAVFNLNGEYHAIEDLCTHDGASMLGGATREEVVEGEEIVCPRHGARFCIRTGAVLGPPAWEPLQRFPVRVQEGMVQVCGEPLAE